MIRPRRLLSLLGLAVVLLVPAPAWATFPVTPVLANFNVDADPIAAPWASAYGTTRNFRAISGTCQWSGAGSGNPSMYRSDQKYGPDLEIYTKLATVSSATNNSPTYLLIIIANPTGTPTPTAYQLAMTMTSAGVFSFVLTRRDNATNPAVVTVTGVSVANSDQIGVGRVGNTLTVYKNGTSLGSGSDATWSGSTAWLGLFSTDAQMQFDDFGGGTLAPAGGAVRHRATTD